MDFKKMVTELSKEKDSQKKLRCLYKSAITDEDKEIILKAILDNPRHRGDVLFVDDRLPKDSPLADLIPDILAEYNKRDPHILENLV